MSGSLDQHSLSAIAAMLRGAGCVFAEEEAQLLMACGKSDAELLLMTEKRISGIPLQIILGRAEFYGLRVSIEPGVFIPRPRSEFLVEQALSVCRPNSIVVDLCGGSGALGMAMISALPQIELYACDIDSIAVRCATQNITPLDGRVSEGDLFDPLPRELKGRVRVLVANAPYVPTHAIEMMPRESREHETRTSIDGGIDGLEIYRRIAEGARHWLEPSGHILVEAGEEQADEMADTFERSGLTAKTLTSKEFDETIVTGRKSTH